MEKKTNGSDKAASIMEEYQSVKNEYGAFHDTMSRIERLTMLDQDEIQTNGTRSKIADPILYGQLIDEVSYFASSKPRGTYVPREYGDMFKAKILNANFQYDWERAGMTMKIIRALKMKKTLGIAYARNTYRKEKQHKKFKSVSENGIKSVEGDYTIFDGPDSELLSFKRVFPQPDAFDWDSMEYIYTEDWVTLDDLKKASDQGGEYMNLSKIADDLDKIESARNSAEFTESDELKKLLSIDPKTNKFKIVNKYTKEKWYTVCGNTLIRNIHNPYAHGQIPISPLYDDVWYDNIIAPSEFFFIERLQRAANKLLNMRFDNVEAMMSPMLRKSPEVDSQIFRIGQFKVLEAEEGELDWFQMQDATGNTFMQSWGSIKDGVKSATGTLDFASQVKPNNPAMELATGLRQQGDRNERRLAYKGMFIDDFVKRIAEQWLSLTRQFAPTKKIIRVAGREMVNYFKENDYITYGPQRTPTRTDEVIRNEGGNIAKALGLAYETGEGEYQPKMKFDDTGDFAWIRLTPEDFSGNYDFIPENNSTVSVDKARRRVEVAGFLETLMSVFELFKAGALRDTALWDISDIFGLPNTDSWFNVSNFKNVITSQQSGFTGQAGRISDEAINAPTAEPGRGFPARPSNTNPQAIMQNANNSLQALPQ